MSYAEDTDDAEQCAQGSDPGESQFELFVEEMCGVPYGSLSNSERDNVLFQWRIRNRKRKPQTPDTKEPT